ncbi:MAG: prohibitin family protein [Bacteroidetes bacterium]|nr:MAG: prohibitin family protein [Bacteroidota bacterium]
MRTILALTFLVSMLSSCVIIRPGEVGVRRTFGRIDDVSLTEGPRGFNPLTSIVLRVPVRTVNLEVKLPLPSKEGLTIMSEMSILYRVSPESAPTLLREIGMDYESEVIMPVFRSAAADISARFLAKDMHSGARSAIEGEISNRMNEILQPRGIIIDNVLMKSIQLPAGLARAIEQKLEAEQEAQRMEFVKESERRDAERRIIQAEGDRDARIIAAEAERRTREIEAEGSATAIKLEAAAQAAANDMLTKSISNEVLRYRAIEAFQQMTNSQNSKVIITNGESPFLGLPESVIQN